MTELFLRECYKKSKQIKFDKHLLEKDYVSIQNFKTKNSSDININLLLLAKKIINRTNGKNKITQYVTQEYIAYEIEKGLFEFALIHVTINKLQDHFVLNIYEEKLFDLCSNLDVNDTRINNTTLLATILSPTFNPYFISFLSPEQLHPKRWMDIISKRQIRDDAVNSFQTTDIYKCAKCGERKFKLTRLQLRCADEPENVFCTCMVCFHTFIK